mmetsp:Transcript_33132/g.84108  ORF Transcript_33132/g.84108 Transcript_33132/m.84108 type:complete len:272 (-) Transcript_33132:386-1201(-)
MTQATPSPRACRPPTRVSVPTSARWRWASGRAPRLRSCGWRRSSGRRAASAPRWAWSTSRAGSGRLTPPRSRACRSRAALRGRSRASTGAGARPRTGPPRPTSTPPPTRSSSPSLAPSRPRPEGGCARCMKRPAVTCAGCALPCRRGWGVHCAAGAYQRAWCGWPVGVSLAGMLGGHMAAVRQQVHCHQQHRRVARMCVVLAGWVGAPMDCWCQSCVCRACQGRQRGVGASNTCRTDMAGCMGCGVLLVCSCGAEQVRAFVARVNVTLWPG